MFSGGKKKYAIALSSDSFQHFLQLLDCNNFLQYLLKTLSAKYSHVEY